MSAGNFFVADVAGTTLACCLFALLFLIPGYVCGFAGDLFGFRGLDLNWRIVASVPLSVAVTPLVVYLSLAAGSPVIPWAVFAIVQFLAASLAFGCFGHEKPAEWISSLKRLSPVAIGIAALWFTVSTLSLADLQFGQRLYFSAVAWDHEFRVAVTDAITRTGIPPATPFNHLGGAAALRYHIFWFAVCSAVERLGSGVLTARHALNASVVWCGLALMCLIALFLRIFEELEGAALRRRVLIGVGLLMVTGLDLIPTLGYYLLHKVPPADMEAWSWGGDQVTSWADALLWVPHHVGAVVAGLTGFLLIWHAARSGGTWRRKIVHATLAGVAFATSSGCSVYVALVLAAALAAWTLLTVILRWYDHTALLAIAGVAAIVFALPNLLRLQHANTGGGEFLALGLWRPAYSETLIRLFHVQSGFGMWAIRLLLLGLTYGVEFGFFFLVGIHKGRQLWAAPKLLPRDAASLIIGGTALLLCTFVRSATISNNDFGWRGFMLLQFVLLLWATGILDAPRPRRLGMAYMLLAVGLAGTVYQFTRLRAYTVLEDADVFEGHRTYALRNVYRQLDALLPTDAIVQSNPDLAVDYWWGLYSHRQAASTGVDCTVTMGGDLQVCRAALPRLRQLFGALTIDRERARAIARSYNLDAVVVSNADPVWKNPAAWIYTSRPAVELPEARAFLFGTAAGGTRGVLQ